MSNIQTIGIIGLGSFGRFAASLVPNGVTILGYDPAGDQEIPGVTKTDIATVATADVIILAVPLDAIASVLEQLKPHLRPETLVVDICSVKMRPQEIFAQHLPTHRNVLLTHPLFGPQSAAHSTRGRRLIVTEAQGERAEQALAFCQQKLGLDICRMSAEAHDKIMAKVHVLTFFVARGLTNMGLGEEKFMTPSYQMLIDLVRFDRTHSDDLFQTIQRGNPFAKEVRQQLLESFARVEADLSPATAHR